MSLKLPQLVKLYKTEQLIELFRRFLEYQENGQCSEIKLDLLMLEILSELGDSHIIHENSKINTTLAYQADIYIKTHFHESLTTLKISIKLGCNPDYLGRIFHQIYHKTLTQAIHEYRLKYACGLLMDSAYNIDEVASKSGFEDAGYFRRIFKRYKGISPSTYRHMYSLVHINTE